MDEVNDLLYLANQMGLITGLFEQTLHNRTKCSTWNAIQESHMQRGNENVIELHDIRGMMILLSIGLSAALLTFIIELILHSKKIKRQVVNDIMLKIQSAHILLIGRKACYRPSHPHVGKIYHGQREQDGG